LRPPGRIHRLDHETFGGGFSPTAVLKLRRLARKVARGSVDRTAYSSKYSLSFI